MIVQKQVNHKKYVDPFIGNKQFISEIYDKIKEFFMTVMPDKDRVPLNIIIQGDHGSGKTHAARTLCEKIQMDHSFFFESPSTNT